MLIMNIYTLWGLRRIFKDVTNGRTKLIYPPFQDSISRNFVKQFFKKQFDVELIDHNGLFVKTESNEFIQYMDGKYCVDLLGFKNDKIFLVEVERSNYKYLYETNNEPVNILVSKYWKYFHDSDKNVIRYMCFINCETKNKTEVTIAII